MPTPHPAHAWDYPGTPEPQCLPLILYLTSYRSGPNVVWKESMVILYMSCSDVGFTLTISGGYTAESTLVSRCSPHLTAPSHKAKITHNGNACSNTWVK